MRKSVLIATLAATAALYIGCFADDSAPGDQAGGSAGRGGSAGSSRGGASGVGGNTAGASGAGGVRDGGGGASDASDAGGATDAAGAGGAGAGGAAGTGGAAGGMAGSGGTGIPDPCEGKHRPLPFTVFSAFTTMRICSGGTCTAPATPYYFTPIPNPNCDEVIPDGGIVPPFADAGPADGDAGAADGDAGAADGNAADAGTEDVVTERSTDGLPMDSAGSEASADISVGTDSGADAEAGADAVEAAADAAAPSCYKFLYNPACPTGLCWGGVVFTQSAGGMADPGICIESGATKITFKARASRPEARIKFGAIREGLLQTEFFLNITTEWATYEVTIPAGEPYNSYSSGATGVWNGFSIIVEPQDHTDGTYIFVKDAVWVK